MSDTSVPQKQSKTSLLIQSDLVSTIIPVFNRPTLIVEAVKSVLSQNYPLIEVIIVDDGSTDNTPQVLQELAQAHSQVRVFTQSNAGPGVARERGRLNAKGEFIQYLDSDDLLLPDKFSAQVAALKQNPKACAAYGKTEVIAMGSKPQQIAHRATGKVQEAMFPAFLSDRWWFTSTPLFRRNVIEQVGPWSDLKNEEDWEYECRIASLGGRLAFVDQFVSLHRVHDFHLSDSGSQDPEKLAHRAMARAKIFQHGKKYMTLLDRPADIKQADWVQFSKYAFLLARQCAKAGLNSEARALVTISIESVGKKTPQHWLFLKLVGLFGWQRAAKIIETMGK